MSRDAKYSTLAEIIEAANRFEQSRFEDKAMLSNKRC